MKKRMRILLWLQIFCLLTGSIVPAFSQLPQQDVQQYPLLHDTAAINLALQRAYANREAHPDASIQLCLQALNSAKELKYDLGTGNALLGLSRVYCILNRNDEAIVFGREALAYCTGDKSGLELETNIYHSMAQVFLYQGKYDSCAWYRYKALNLVENHPTVSTQTQMRAYGSILQFWMNAHDDIQHDRYIQEIMEHINTIEKTALATKDSNLLVSVYFQKEAYYENIRKKDSSRYYCQLTIDLGRRLKVTPSVVVATLLNMSISYLEDNEPEKAIQRINEAMAEMPDANKASNRYTAFASFALGEAYYQQKKYAKALSVLLPALVQVESLHTMMWTDYAHKTLAKTYDAIGAFDKSATHWRQYADIRDSLVKDKKMELVYNVEMKYRIADKERELAQKELSIARNEATLKAKNFWIGGILTGTLLIILLGMLLFRNNKHKQKLQAEKIRNLHQELQIASLQAMIAGEEKERSRVARELHDGMGGTLATIRTRLSYVFRKMTATGETSQDLTEILQLLEEASVELRKTAHNLMPEILLREGLAKASLLFCERVRKGHMLEINTEIWGEIRRLPKDFELTAYRIIQELVHNTLKHARATQALVQIVFHETLLCITVEDNGTGIPDNNWQQAEGMGLKTIQERVRSLNGQIDIASSPGKGTSVYIELNIITSRQNVME